MSRGPGRVEQIIEAAFNAEPDNAFSVEDLCDRVYPNQPAEKKHRVSVLRAAKNIAKRRNEIDTITGENLGGTVIHRCSLGPTWMLENLSRTRH